VNARFRQKGQITIPAPIREKACVAEGDVVDVSYRPGEIVIHVQRENGNGNGNGAPPDFLPPEWTERIERSIAELDAGRGEVFEDEDDFFASLDD
jgi:AbrB family looped-hinge helix DNA binding protein